MKTTDWQSNAIIDLSKLVEEIELGNMVVILAIPVGQMLERSLVIHCAASHIVQPRKA
jgi:hypothetical protein